MEERKNLFELLDPKSALVVGAVGGLLTIGTLGFIILGVLTLKGKISISKTDDLQPPVAQQQQPSQQQANNTPQAQQTVPKTSKPKVDLFVMSYCPFGLQMEKAYAPVYNLLKDKAEMSIKFVYYAMHGKKEVDENTRQYCIQSEQPAKYPAYLNCFFTAGQNNGAEADYQKCLTSAGVNQTQLSSCVSKTDKQFAITAKYNDQGSWLNGQFPLYPIYDAENNQYQVQGSPTLVINGVQANVARSPEAVKQAICNAFTNAPAECQKTLDNTQFQAGFGLATTGGANFNPTGAGGAGTPGCGT